ncbi:hypothetical protein [Streptomyces nodosus]|uniref:hypothetical protein n=1 Tax=Streptomyces nodosus TaxID=40318 RepID=UPI000ADE1413|nr:hypothetical protein [Streptomyces nodosus]MBB4789568.1 YD repeat-containing protein [Streptomyces nodosus]
MQHEQDPAQRLPVRHPRPTRHHYTRDSDGEAIAADATQQSVHGQTIRDTGTTGGTRDQAYTYDANTNRTALATSTGDVGAPCTSTGATTTSYSYDSADRLVVTGTVDDALGRTTTQAPGTTIGYYANDLVRQ